MNLEKRINAFVKLGLFLGQFKTGEKNNELSDLNNQFYDDFDELIHRQKSYNGWFTRENVLQAIQEISNSLTLDELSGWLKVYEITSEPKKIVGVIMAGNLPLVGFHDFLSVLITGNSLKIKMASDDKTLLPMITKVLLEIEPEFKDRVLFVDKLESFDAVIATGSNNTSRYFEQYFGGYPHIIRKSRNSVGIVHSNDRVDDLKPLGNDLFQYFGLGCRSVSKIYIPKNYRIDTIYEAIFDYKDVVDNNKYANNYDYNKAVYLLDSNQLLDNSFLLLKEDEGMSSPVGVLYYQYYSDLGELEKHLEDNKDRIQCVVSSKNTPVETVEFGKSQCPALNDYADGIDVIEFLLKLA